MTQWQQIDSDRIPGGAELTFHRRNNEFMLRADGLELMTSSASGSERQLIHEALDHLEIDTVRSVLIGGLGLGFTLAEACKTLPQDCQITTVEISPKVKEWVASHLSDKTGCALTDPRVSVEIADITEFLGRSDRHYDLILSDIDNGPHAFVVPSNDRLYEIFGLELVRSKLSRKGCVVFWSGSDEPEFCDLLAKVFPKVTTHTYTLPQAPKIKQYLFAAYKADEDSR